MTTAIAGFGILAPASALAAPSSLGAFWRLDESTGTVANDSSGYNNTGTLSGPQHITGRFRRALAFDGTDDEMRVARSESLEPDRVTVETWVRAPQSPGAHRYLVGKGAKACQTASYGLYTGQSGGLAFYVADDSGTFAVSPNAEAGVWDGGWHHVAGTFDGATVRLFVDGAEVGSGTPTGVALAYGLPDGDDLLAGLYGGPCASTQAYNGDLDEPRVWRRALGPVEVAASAAMGGATTRGLGIAHYSDDAVVFTQDFASGRGVTISTESSSGAQRIKSVRVVAIVPALAAVTCGNGLSSSCAITLSNEARTAKLSVRRGLGSLLASHATLRVELVSGRAFNVEVDIN